MGLNPSFERGNGSMHNFIRRLLTLTQVILAREEIRA